MHRKIRQIPVLAFDIAAASLIAVVLMAGFAAPAQAYVDPSVMTYTIQALAGVAVALSAVLGVAWRRIRRGLYKILKIDENAGKVKEPAVVQCTGEALEQADVEATQERAFQGIEKPHKLPWFARFIVAALVVGTFAFTQLYSAPLEIVATNSSAFQFTYLDLLQPLMTSTLIVGVIATVILSIFRGKPFEILVAILIAISICAMLQAIGLNQRLPQANGAEVDWMRYWKWMLASGFMWVFIIGICVAVAIKKPSWNNGVAVIASILLIASTAINLKATLDDNAPSDNPEGELVLTKQGLNTVSDKSNIVWIVLDTLDTEYLDTALSQYPDLLDDYTGFTWFHNTTSQSAPTRYTVPSLVTGNFYDFTEEYTIDVSAENKQFFTEENLLDKAKAQGYSVGVYSDTVYWGTQALSEDTINVHPIGEIEVNNVETIIGTLYKCSFYRNAPWVLKPLFRYYTDDINKAVVSQKGDDDANTAYVLDDFSYYHDLTTKGLKIEEDTAGAYRFIHLVGDHQPFTMTADLELGRSDKYEQAAASMKITAAYLNELKKLGVYDNSTIIVCADHGVYDWEGKPTPDHPTTPLIMIKPADADSSARVKISNAPVSQYDLSSTIEAALGLETSEQTIFDIPEGEDRVRYYYNNEEADTGNVAFHENKIDGDVNSWSSWSLTGRTWPHK